MIQLVLVAISFFEDYMLVVGTKDANTGWAPGSLSSGAALAKYRHEGGDDASLIVCCPGVIAGLSHSLSFLGKCSFSHERPILVGTLLSYI